LALTAAAPAAALPGDEAGAHFDYLYLQANEGGSSGGHAAIRIGDWTYHFQHDRGLLRMRREGWDRFEHAYRTLQNRGIARTRVAVGRETGERLRRGFQRRYLVQERQLAVLADLERDAELLFALASEVRGRAAAPGFELPGAGFFGEGAGTQGWRSADLLRRVASHHGGGFLEARRRALERSLSALDAEPPPASALEVDGTRYAGRVESLWRRYAELWSGLLALDLLERPRLLAAAALVPDGGEPERALDAAELERLDAWAETLAEGAARLVASARPDWGGALLLTLARLAALERSLASGRLVLLDPLPADAERLPLTPRRRAVLPLLLADAQLELERARGEALGAAGWSESGWNALELAAARRHELGRASAGAGEIRVHGGWSLPEARARVAQLPLPALGPELLARRAEETRTLARRYRAALRGPYGYHLITRNCVSELFRTIEAALADGLATPPSGDASAAIRAESRRRLGGYVAPVAGLNFVPFVSSHRVRASYDVLDEEWLPSYRRSRMREMARGESALWVALRESNAFSASLYTPGDEDGFFVFFTDGPLWWRPVLGAANLAGALAFAGVGAARLPLDRGASLGAALRGALFSLPELVFVNLRKGSNDYVPPGDAHLAERSS